MGPAALEQGPCQEFRVRSAEKPHDSLGFRALTPREPPKIVQGLDTRSANRQISAATILGLNESSTIFRKIRSGNRGCVLGDRLQLIGLGDAFMINSKRYYGTLAACVLALSFSMGCSNQTDFSGASLTAEPMLQLDGAGDGAGDAGGGGGGGGGGSTPTDPNNPDNPPSPGPSGSPNPNPTGDVPSPNPTDNPPNPAPSDAPSPVPSASPSVTPVPSPTGDAPNPVPSVTPTPTPTDKIPPGKNPDDPKKPDQPKNPPSNPDSPKNPPGKNPGGSGECTDGLNVVVKEVQIMIQGEKKFSIPVGKMVDLSEIQGDIVAGLGLDLPKSGRLMHINIVLEDNTVSLAKSCLAACPSGLKIPSASSSGIKLHSSGFSLTDIAPKIALPLAGAIKEQPHGKCMMHPEYKF
jgi:hypothetical protein